ncbi:hypothetical protein [Haloferula sp. BvORR071]|uniref:hypothetical protein n=1 Tax=Haloferula sp. BvORR071 TaxID=1396141 RepID=UPI00055643EF|nr:hypothetical protein [Haloferula sp. BvORR071]
MSFDEAEHHADRRRFRQAWAVIDELPPDARMTPRALRVSLRCCAGLARWDLGQEIAALLATGEMPDRECAAGFYHLLAVAHLQDGDKREAILAASRAVDAWKPARVELFEDNRLAGLF